MNKILNKEIEYWKQILNGTEIEYKNGHPLCSTYRKDSCKDCPVYNKTNIPYCETTHYEDWCDHHISNHLLGFFIHKGSKVLCKGCSIIAEKHIEFLQYLLKETLRP